MNPHPRAFYHRSIFMLLVLLASCAPPAQQPPPASPLKKTTIPVSAPAQTGVWGRLGQWRVESIAGVPLGADDSPIEIALGVTTIHATSQCVWFRFIYEELGEGRVKVSAEPLPSPLAMCARSQTKAETAFPQSMLAATNMALRADNKLEFSGPQGAVVLAQPPGPVRNPFGYAPAPDIELFGAWRVTAINGAPMTAGDPMGLLVGFDWMEAISGCVVIDRSYAQTADEAAPPQVKEGTIALDVAPRDTNLAVCERGRTPVENALETALMGRVRVTSPAPDTLLLESSRGVVRIER